MPSYQIEKLRQYEPRFVQVAEDLFERVSRQVPARHPAEPGGFGQAARAPTHLSPGRALQRQRLSTFMPLVTLPRTALCLSPSCIG